MTTFTVTSLADSGAGSLREALASAETSAGDDVIEFAAGISGGTITLTSGQLNIASGGVTIHGDIDGNGSADVTISGDANSNNIADAGDSGILRIEAGANATLEGLIFAHGAAVGAPGAITGDGGNFFRDPGQSAGGAIENFGTLTVTGSTFQQNHATGGVGLAGVSFPIDPYDLEGTGGGDAAGAILNGGSLTVTDSTFEGNVATGGQGASGGYGESAFVLGQGGPVTSAETGGEGGDGGSAAGGILNLAGATLILSGATFLEGSATGGAGANGGGGGGGVDEGLREFAIGGANGGAGGDGGSAAANIINHGSLDGDATADDGTSVAGAAGAGGPGGPGGNGFINPDGPDGATGAAGDPGDASPIINDGTGDVDLFQLGREVADTFTGGADVDRYDGRGGNDSISGLGGADILRGGAGDDTILGGDGNDQLDGGTGADRMTGGADDDTYTVDNYDDRVIETANGGHDTIHTSLNTCLIAANVEDVVFTGTGAFVGVGNALDNSLTGGAGNDRFVHSTGADAYHGGGGVDAVDYRLAATGASLDFLTGTFSGAAAGDTFDSIEKFFGSNTAADTMIGGATGRYSFAGFGGADSLVGGAEIDRLDGGAGNDTLIGGGGADALTGGAGNDQMTGGTGADSFVFVSLGFGQDVITDFEDGVDRLKIHTAVATELGSFSITGDGTATVTLALVSDPTQTITLHGAGGANISLSAQDFLFY